MPRDLDLLRRLRLAGLDVLEVAGWQTRGAAYGFEPRVAVIHHTAGPRTGWAPSLGICTNGRSDLPGPLCNVFGPREESYRVHLVAAGKANHAGNGGWQGATSNYHTWGLEEEHTGTVSEPISDLRIDRMARVAAAFLFGTRDATSCAMHWEWAGPRKIDFLRAHIDPHVFRRMVQAHLNRMADPAPIGDDDVRDEDLPRIAEAVANRLTPEFWRTAVAAGVAADQSVADDFKGIALAVRRIDTNLNALTEKVNALAVSLNPEPDVLVEPPAES